MVRYYGIPIVCRHKEIKIAILFHSKEQNHNEFTIAYIFVHQLSNSKGRHFGMIRGCWALLRDPSPLVIVE